MKIKLREKLKTLEFQRFCKMILKKYNVYKKGDTKTIVLYCYKNNKQ